MTELLLAEAALFQIRTAAAAAAVDDAALRLAINVLGGAIAGARESVNAARVAEIEFAVSDVEAIVRELPEPASSEIGAPLVMLREDLTRLRKATALPHDLLQSLHAFQSKLRLRKDAIERQTYVEGADAGTLPHPPDELRREALPIRERLAAAGYATPALDTLVDDPESLRFHSIGEILNELDVIG